MERPYMHPTPSLGLDSGCMIAPRPVLVPLSRVAGDTSPRLPTPREMTDGCQETRGSVGDSDPTAGPSMLHCRGFPRAGGVARSRSDTLIPHVPGLSASSGRAIADEALAVPASSAVKSSGSSGSGTHAHVGQRRQGGRPVLAPSPGAAAPAAARVCPVCFEALDPAAGETFCGVHLFCADCAGRSARAELRQGLVPRCPECHVAVEPVAAQRILRVEDLERYYRLALWSNEGVAACPRCREGLYADAGEDLSAAGRCQSGCCPACGYAFCIECRGPAHPDVADCDEAERLRLRRGRRHGAEICAGGLAAAPATPMACRTAGRSGPPGTGRGAAAPQLRPSPELEDASGAPALPGCKACPRCRAPVQKCDEASCDHMTCTQCRHEFCWSCLADRVAIFAHGNHFHRPSCPFHAPFHGPPEYLPERCRRCAHRGSACVPPTGVCIDATAITPAAQLGALDTWFWRLLELLTLRSCQVAR
mmetsp:Transcript_119105/g.362336  ORF Transcript_119105/g.362336 Transcript_119105/m.362336 type:complete len:478 (-) Transcript_119105:203-1636(-)